MDRDSNVYVFEGQDLEIRVYGPDGELRRRIGRQGEGPGEFRAWPEMGVLGDTVWTIEAGLGRRITLFSRDGRHLTTSGPIEGVRVAVQSETMEGVVMPRSMLPGGSFISDMTTFVGRRDAEPTGVQADDTVLVPRVRFSPSGEVLDTVGYDVRPPPGPSAPREELTIDGTEFRIPTPPSDRPLSISLTDGRIFVERTVATSPDEGIFTVTRLDLARDTAFHRRFRYRPRPYTEAALDTIALRRARLPSGGYRIMNGQPVYPDVPGNVDELRARLREAMSFPAFMPPVGYAHLADDGALWLQREDDGGDVLPWIVLRPDGSPVGELVLPRRARVRWSRGETAWVVETDGLDVPWLVRYRIVEGG